MLTTSQLMLLATLLTVWAATIGATVETIKRTVRAALGEEPGWFDVVVALLPSLVGALSGVVVFDLLLSLAGVKSASLGIKGEIVAYVGAFLGFGCGTVSASLYKIGREYLQRRASSRPLNDPGDSD